ncbi:U3 small nucleolar RNA-associated protein 25 homolog [Rhynchophorus ferrugineus]|uniref:U3 small nucleolar RNA-associated protein 25 homolog n=1 Tax=Rhynchophorus ferrugineus TaxID=354439 RepID=UPI003FCEB8DA
MGKKLKYKDVVKRGPPVSNKKPKKGQFNKRKTYSIYKTQNSFKRKSNNDDNSYTSKRHKLEKPEEPEIQQKVVEESSESEEEIFEDPLKQLRDTFTRSVNDSIISESDSDDVSEGNDTNDDNIKDTPEISDDEVSNEDSDLDNSTDENNECAEDSDVEKGHEDNVDNVKDPFVNHISYELHPNLLEVLESDTNSVNTTMKVWPVLGNVIFQVPKCEINEPVIKSKLDTTVYATPGEIPKKISKNSSSDDLFIKKQISKNIRSANKSLRTGENMFTPLQQELFSLMNNYQDVYYPNRTFDNAEEIVYTYCLHAINHVLKTRIKVLHHNSKISKKDDVPDEFRDQGLVRPKVLILAPFKSSAYKIVNTIIDIMFEEDKGNIIKKNRFVEDYTGNELRFPKRNPKPEDYERVFCGNTGDDFKMGISVTKKSLKLYSDFYSSDILVASPLGLRTIIGAEGEVDRDFDFLTSIELLILDQTDIFFMQNWDHVIHLFNHMHLKPKDLHGTDVSRVRQWCLNLWAKYYRQTLIFSSVTLPEINAIFNKKCFNYAGKAKVSNPVELGCINQVFVQLPHVFQRFEASSPAEAIEARFNFFINKILPQQRDSLMKQTLIYVPSYYDYVRVRNYFKKEDVSFVQICEYSKEGKIARARDMFYHGDAHFLLYTERYHFYNRIRVKGIRHLVFYQPPNIPGFYHEMSNLMQEINMNKKIGSMANMTVTVIYSKYDILQVAAIVGSERASKMCQSDRKVHMLVTGSD